MYIRPEDRRPEAEVRTRYRLTEDASPRSGRVPRGTLPGYTLPGTQHRYTEHHRPLLRRQQGPPATGGPTGLRPTGLRPVSLLHALDLVSTRLPTRLDSVLYINQG